MKVFFTAWLTVHLFCFGVLYKNLKKFEILYIVTSLFVPIVIPMVPLITGSYHINALGCYIYDFNGTNPAANIEWFALWHIPTLVILLVASAAMAIVAINLAYKVRFRQKTNAITNDDKYRKALKQLLPLAAFPILFFLFVIPVIVFGVEEVESSNPNESVILAAAVFIAMWAMSSGVALLVHISVARIYCKRRKHVQENLEMTSREDVHQKSRIATESVINSVKHFSLPRDSLSSDCYIA